MRTAGMAFAVLVLALSGTAALAQECPPVVSVAPSYPAVLGAGPAPALANLTGTDFDRAYIEQMYQLHTNITALTTQGIEQSTDKNLKDLSGKIRYEQTKQNEILATKYMDMGLGKIPVNYASVQPIVDSLINYTGNDYNTLYAKTLVGMLMQQRDASQLGVSRLSDPRLRDQAQIVANASQNEINVLQRWIAEKGTSVVAPVAPAGVGTGPMPPNSDMGY